MVASSEVVEAGGGAKEIAEGSAGDGAGKAKELTEGNEEGKRWLKLFGEVTEILNRGGAAEEKLLEARARLSEEMKGMGGAA
jgi:hypothetical protein